MNHLIEEIFVRIRLKVSKKMTKKPTHKVIMTKTTAKRLELKANSSLVFYQSLAKLFWMKMIKNGLKKIKCYLTRHSKKKAATI